MIINPLAPTTIIYQFEYKTVIIQINAVDKFAGGENGNKICLCLWGV